MIIEIFLNFYHCQINELVKSFFLHKYIKVNKSVVE